MYIRYPLSLRQVENLLFERGIGTGGETMRIWRNRFGPTFAAQIRKRRDHHRSYCRWCWHRGNVPVRGGGEPGGGGSDRPRLSNYLESSY